MSIRFAEWGWAEVRAIVYSLFQDYRSQLKSLYEAEFQNSEVFLVNSARSGLGLVLEELKKECPDKKNVILPSYVCPSLVEAVEQAGLGIQRVTVGEDLNITPFGIEISIDENTLAVIGVHMYGCSAKIQEIEKICCEKNVVLIDDAAQLGWALGDRRPMGSFGDFGLVSFAQSKSIVTGVRGSGGVLLVNNGRWSKKFQNMQESLPRPRGRWNQLIYFLADYQWKDFLGRMPYYWARVTGKVGNAKPFYYYPLAQIANFEAAIACAQLASFERRAKSRTAVVDAYVESMEQARWIRLPQASKGTYLTRLMVQLPDGVSKSEVRAFLADNGIGTRNSYPGVDNLLELPSSSTLSEQDVRYICNKLDLILGELVMRPAVK